MKITLRFFLREVNAVLAAIDNLELGLSDSESELGEYDAKRLADLRSARVHIERAIKRYNRRLEKMT